MFCSISTSKSTSTWLDRLHLRSSTAFSGAGAGAGDNSVEDQTKPTNLSSEQTDPEAQFSSIPSPSEGAPFLGDVLAELFAFGPDPPVVASKKNPRKIANPKCCKVNSFEGDLELRVVEVQRSGSGRREGEGEGGKERGKEVVVGKKRVLCEEEEKVDLNLSGFSRTEVAVIDTSFKGWKFEKVLFRKKSVWKIRDRKSRGFDFENSEKKKVKKKKRKLSVEKEEEEEEGVGVCKKKKKMVFGQCGSSKEGKRGRFSMQMNDELNRKLSAEEEEVSAWKKKKKVSRQCSSSKENKRGDFSMQMSDELHRKLSAEEGEEVGVYKKKKKIVFGRCSSSEEGKRGDFPMRRNDEGVAESSLLQN